MDRTNRIGAPLLTAGQLEKEIFHNEALLLCDALISGVVAPDVFASPPGQPVRGTCYRIGSGASGDWAGQDGRLAIMTQGGWRFVEPFEGLSLSEQGSGARVVYSSAGWEVGVERAVEIRVGGIKVVGPQQGAITAPSGGSTVDSESRTVLAAILTALRNHGLVAS